MKLSEPLLVIPAKVTSAVVPEGRIPLIKDWNDGVSELLELEVGRPEPLVASATIRAPNIRLAFARDLMESISAFN